jgi:hypothetical protein
MDFQAFLVKKRIDGDAFRTQRPQEWERYAQVFAEIGEVSFDQQKKFLFNPWRIAFPASEPLPQQLSQSYTPPKMKPIMKKPEPTEEEKQDGRA